MTDPNPVPVSRRARAAGGILIIAGIIGGIAVNVADMPIFAFRAKPSPMRTNMLLLDGAALAFPCAVALVLLLRRCGPRSAGRVELGQDSL